jgi:lysophospholipase L1-like esterase
MHFENSKWVGAKQEQSLRVMCAILFMLALASSAVTRARNSEVDQKWVASWTAAMLSGRTLDRIDGFPNQQATDQTFRMVIKPDLWGDTIRIKFSNAFGNRDIRLSAASVGLQETAAQLLPGTNVGITFGGESRSVIPRQEELVSDPIHLPFVTDATKFWLRGRNLAVSFAIDGDSGVVSYHGASVYSYASKTHSGNLVSEEDGSNFSLAVKMFLFVSALDVMADSDTEVICAFGDSITDGGTTLNGYDGWSDVLSRRLHMAFGEKVSVVNMAIAGNTVYTPMGDVEPAVKRLDRDVLSISGLSSVIWLEGINDLVFGPAKASQIMDAMRDVGSRLHKRGIRIVGATLTPNLRPSTAAAKIPRSQFLFPAEPNSKTVNAERMKLNKLIATSEAFDAVVDMSSATEDPKTGAFYKDMQKGDWIHPNRLGHQVMANAVDLNLLVVRPGKSARPDYTATGNLMEHSLLPAQEGGNSQDALNRH